MKASKVLEISGIVLATILALIISDNPVFGVLCMSFLIYVAVTETKGASETSEKLRFLKELDRFLGNLRHHYFRTNSIRDALFFGTDGIREPLRAELTEMLSILEDTDRRVKGSMYQNSEKDRYLRLLMSVIMLMEENGDSVNSEGSVFINAVMQLRMEVRDERRFISNRKHKFMGLSLTSALPVASVQFISSWGVKTNPNLLLFYYGRWGMLFRLVILMISFICYRIILNLRVLEYTAGRNRYDTARVLRWFDELGKTLKRAVLFSLSGTIMLISLITAHREAVSLLKCDASNIEMICDVADGRQIAAMEYLIPLYTQELLTDENRIVSKDEIVMRLLGEIGIRSEEVAQTAADEIIRRVNAVKNEKVDIWDLLIVLTVSIIGALYPDIGELFDKLASGGRIKEEIMQLQTIVSIQKDVQGISPVIMLESLECFGQWFKKALRRCINNIGINEGEALQQLKISCEDDDFERIADCFILADELGVKEAFDEISSEIKAFREDRRSERSIRLDNDVLLATLVAVIPGGLILFGYLLVPFMVSALNMFNSYQDSLKDYISIS
ncbi:MAG: hypothetical protein K6E85_10000 [Lachnospiraceae bacterium]|nr:hypothetical protein [Lachnospiraceae bacterium]